jgi:antitoxin component of MazEF toxin-antitoxin module
MTRRHPSLTSVRKAGHVHVMTIPRELLRGMKMQHGELLSCVVYDALTIIVRRVQPEDLAPLLAPRIDPYDTDASGGESGVPID